MRPLPRSIAAICLALVAACATPPRADQAALAFRAVPINPANPAQDRVGRLRYLGGLLLTGGGSGFGGLSALRWQGSRLFAVSDEGRWFSFEPVERGERLTGVRALASGALHGLGGAVLDGKTAADAESLSRAPGGGWLVGFERDHRIWRYPALDGAARPSGIDPAALLGPLAANNGVEALALTPRGLLACAERPGPQANCVVLEHDGRRQPLTITVPAPLDQRGAVPTDADAAPDGTRYVLLRSFAPLDGPAAALVALDPDGRASPLAVLLPPLTIDNMEGLALRQAGRRTFLYLVSDNNFSASQRTLLLKFEVLDSAR